MCVRGTESDLPFVRDVSVPTRQFTEKRKISRRGRLSGRRVRRSRSFLLEPLLIFTTYKLRLFHAQKKKGS